MKSTGSVYHTVLGDINAAKGEYRNGNVSAGGHYFVAYDKVPCLTKQLTETIQLQLERATTAEEKLQLAFGVLYELVSIYPFYDGYGRTSRLLMNYLLERSGLPLCLLYKEDKAYIMRLFKKDSKKETSNRFLISCTGSMKSICWMKSAVIKALTLKI